LIQYNKSEIRTIPSSGSYFIRLEEVPFKETPSSVNITYDSIQFIEKTTNDLHINEFYVDYVSAFIYFSPENAENQVTINYKGIGSIIMAEDVDDLQNAVYSLDDLKLNKIIGTTNNLILIDSDGSAIKDSNINISDSITSENNLWTSQRIYNEIYKIKKIYKEIPSGDINGTNRTFILQHLPIDNSEKVFLNGLLLKAKSLYPNDYDYELTNNNIYFSSTTIPMTGDSLMVSYEYI
jgi:hypothetical protein